MRELLDSVIFLFAIVDAPGNLPIFMEMMEGVDRRMRRRIYDVASVAGLVIIVVFALAGRFVLKHVFQIEVPEFQIAGGLLLAAIGIHPMVAEREPGTRKAAHGLEIAVPIACPLLVGSGSTSRCAGSWGASGCSSSPASCASSSSPSASTSSSPAPSPSSSSK